MNPWTDMMLWFFGSWIISTLGIIVVGLYRLFTNCIIGAILFIWLFSGCAEIGGAIDGVVCGTVAMIYTPIWKAGVHSRMATPTPTPTPKPAG